MTPVALAFQFAFVLFSNRSRLLAALVQLIISLFTGYLFTSYLFTGSGWFRLSYNKTKTVHFIVNCFIRQKGASLEVIIWYAIYSDCMLSRVEWDWQQHDSVTMQKNTFYLGDSRIIDEIIWHWKNSTQSYLCIGLQVTYIIIHNRWPAYWVLAPCHFNHFIRKVYYCRSK